MKKIFLKPINSSYDSISYLNQYIRLKNLSGRWKIENSGKESMLFIEFFGDKAIYAEPVYGLFFGWKYLIKAKEKIGIELDHETTYWINSDYIEIVTQYINTCTNCANK